MALTSNPKHKGRSEVKIRYAKVADWAHDQLKHRYQVSTNYKVYPFTHVQRIWGANPVWANDRVFLLTCVQMILGGIESVATVLMWVCV